MVILRETKSLTRAGFDSTTRELRPAAARKMEQLQAGPLKGTQQFATANVHPGFWSSALKLCARFPDTPMHKNDLTGLQIGKFSPIFWGPEVLGNEAVLGPRISGTKRTNSREARQVVFCIGVRNTCAKFQSLTP